MRTLFFCAILTNALLTVACSDSTQSQPPATPLNPLEAKGTFSAIINGAPWRATELTVMSRVIALSGIDTQSKVAVSLVFDRQNAVTAKTVILDKENVTEGITAYKVNADGTRSVMASSTVGKITMTNVREGHMEGTFEMQSGSDFFITDGKFSIDHGRF
jgi:hypothetical protein